MEKLVNVDKNQVLLLRLNATKCMYAFIDLAASHSFFELSEICERVCEIFPSADFLLIFSKIGEMVSSHEIYAR